MAPRIDPAIPQLWYSPTEVRFGGQRERVVLTDVGRAEELIITALRAGTPHHALSALLDDFGTTQQHLDQLLEQLSPVFIDADTGAEPAIPPRVALERSTLWPDRPSRFDYLISDALTRAGAVLVSRNHDVELAVVLATHVVAPAVASYWLSNDVPLLPIVLGDESITLGPLVIPGVTSCLHCVDLHRVDDDLRWPALAAQLMHASHAGPTYVDPVVALEVASMLSRAVRNLADSGRSGLEGVSMSVAVPSGKISERQWPAHPRCSCRDLQENATGSVVSLDAVRASPTRDATSPARA
jgi:bacteriocin biosynthesis cyclodehydratase domain-containing protein